MKQYRHINITAAILLISNSLYAADTSARYVNCMDYNTVGNGLCRPEDPVPEGPKRADAPKPDPVQEFLDNHGKPPREFAEFYANPTPENAQKWNQAFRAQQMRAMEISKAWKAAIEADAATTQPPQAAVPPVVQSVGVKQPVAKIVSNGALQPMPKTTRLGAFATGAEDRGSLTYYFSVSDPNSAKMSATLGAVYSGGKSKYKFTCVDLTPLSDKFQASPMNRGGLPCDWRMPRAGEVESLKIQQTPVLVVQRPNTPQQQIVGNIDQQQLINMLR